MKRISQTAVVVDKDNDVEKISEIFISDIAMSFKMYFGIDLDPYIKSSVEFRERLKKGQPPIKNLMRSYSVLYGKDPLEV